MPPSGTERPLSRLTEAATRQREYYRAGLARSDMLLAQINDLKPPKLEAEPPINPNGQDWDAVMAAVTALKTIRERNELLIVKFNDEYDAMLAQVDFPSSGPEPKHDPDHDDTEDEDKSQQAIDDDVSQFTDNASIQTREQRNPSEPAHQSEISFDEVYQSGEANPKDIIVEYPRSSGKYYILRCSDCKIPPFAPFDPIRAAGKHLDIAKHGHQSRSNENAIKKLGIRVLNCTKELSDKNNKAYREWFTREDPQRAHRGVHSPLGTPGNDIKRKRTAQARSSHSYSLDDTWLAQYNGASNESSNKRKRVSYLPPSEIKAGRLYCVDNSKGIYQEAVVILPLFEEWPDWKTAYLKTPEQLSWWDEPTLQPPKGSFEYDPGSNVPRAWASDFKNNGSRVNSRAYPAVFIKGDQWVPAKTEVDWVVHKDLRIYEKHQVIGEQHKGAADYEERRKEAERRQTGAEKGMS